MDLKKHFKDRFDSFPFKLTHSKAIEGANQIDYFLLLLLHVSSYGAAFDDRAVVCSVV